MGFQLAITAWRYPTVSFHIRAVIWVRASYIRVRLFVPSLLRQRSALTSAFPDFPVQYFQGRKWVVLTTLTWLGGQNHFLPIAYLVTSGLILLAAVILTVVWWKFGKNGNNMQE